jgi:7-cyano-7-deazaguanine synthase
MARFLAVVVLSGGMDSCVAAAVAARAHDLAFLHVHYGQRTEGREFRAFEEIAEYYGVRRRLAVDARSLSAIGGSSLTDASMPVPEAGRGEVPTTYVPFRNAHLLCVGVSWAEVIGAKAVYVGVEAESGYPDCSPAFIEAFNRAVAEGMRPGSGIQVIAPLAAMTKAEIVRLGVALGAPLRLTWSCYAREDLACGRCESCALRLRGVRLGGVVDPIPYET